MVRFDLLRKCSFFMSYGQVASIGFTVCSFAPTSPTRAHSYAENSCSERSQTWTCLGSTRMGFLTVSRKHSFDTNPIYPVLHELIYSQGCVLDRSYHSQGVHQPIISILGRWRAGLHIASSRRTPNIGSHTNENFKTKLRPRRCRAL